MSEVTGLRESRGMVDIYVDGVRALSIKKKHFDLKPLENGDEVELTEYVDSIAGLQFSDAYEAALTSLDASERTRSELVKALCRKGFVKPAAEAVADKLCEIKLIDDARYAARIVQNASSKPIGAMNVRRKLVSKGVSSDEIDAATEALDAVQQSGAALAAAKKLYKKYSALPEREARSKLSMALARRGFSWSAVQSAVEELLKSE